MQDRLTSRFFMGEVDWATAKVFPVIADLHGYLRINLRGRESPGVVEPGAEYDRLCETLAEGLMTFVDADTQQPVVSDVRRCDELFGDGTHLHELPDLIVRWAPSDAATHRAIASPRHGSIAWPDPGSNPDGRSGNHRPEGFLLAERVNDDFLAFVVVQEYVDLALHNHVKRIGFVTLTDDYGIFRKLPNSGLRGDTLDVFLRHSAKQRNFF